VEVGVTRGPSIARVGFGLGLALALAAIGCSDTPPLFGPPTQSECPPGSALTWDSFGSRFMADYCTSCHHSELLGEARHGAPSFHDFDTVYGVRAVDEHVDAHARRAPPARRVARLRRAVAGRACPA
jgi:hypothetical protein